MPTGGDGLSQQCAADSQLVVLQLGSDTNTIDITYIYVYIHICIYTYICICIYIYGMYTHCTMNGSMQYIYIYSCTVIIILAGLNIAKCSMLYK